VTRDPAGETAPRSETHYGWTNTNAFSWTLRNVAIYLKNIKFLMFVVKSRIVFWGGGDEIKYTEHAGNRSLFK
jgi:hypothetical protein